ncbi:MAG: hypothetical protein JNM59_00835 [Hyphomonadaceae bacterium]|nr:hypothetical protein [Hyphomonadaceae bacterium]
MLTIAWFTAHVLAIVAPETAKREIARYARWATLLIVAQALARVPTPLTYPRPRHDRRPPRRLSARGMAGVSIRRALRGPTWVARLGAIRAAIKQPERMIARVMRRLRIRFTKLRVLPAPPRAGAALASTPSAPMRRDSS